MQLTAIDYDRLGTLCAYDYDRQEWITGYIAIPVILKNIDSDLSVLKECPQQGRDFLRWCGADPDTLEDVIARLEHRRKGLVELYAEFTERHSA